MLTEGHRLQHIGYDRALPAIIFSPDSGLSIAKIRQTDPNNMSAPDQTNEPRQHEDVADSIDPIVLPAQKEQPWRKLLTPADVRQTEGSDEIRLQLEKDEYSGDGG